MADELPTSVSKPMSMLKKTVLQLSVGVALGFLVACLAGPRVISFWYQPPSKDAFSCAGSVENALAQFIWLQLGCAALGAFVLWLTLYFTGRLWRGKRPNTTSLP